MEVVVGRKSSEIDRAELLRLLHGYAEVWIDIGTGNGVFAYDAARERPDIFVIALDANRDNLRHFSAKARKKPARGGLPNVLYVIGSADSMPPELAGLGARLFVNFPWGSLLQGVVKPEAAILKELRGIAAPSASITLLLNYSVFGDDRLIGTLDLPKVTLDHVRETLVPAYAAAGMVIESFRILLPEEIPYRTEWGQKLTVAGSRDTLRIDARVARADPADALRG